MLCNISYPQVRSRFKAGFNEVKKHYHDYHNGHDNHYDDDDDDDCPGEKAKPVSGPRQV